MSDKKVAYVVMNSGLNLLCSVLSDEPNMLVVRDVIVMSPLGIGRLNLLDLPEDYDTFFIEKSSILQYVVNEMYEQIYFEALSMINAAKSGIVVSRGNLKTC